MNTRIDLHRFDDEIRALERSIEKSPPTPGAILLYGSSTMAYWRANDMCYNQLAPLPIVNHGFGGSTAEEALYYYSRLVVPTRPSVLAYYEGANDLMNGYASSEVMETTHRLFEWARQDFPGVQFVILPIKPSPALEPIREEAAACNDLFAAYACEHADTRVVDLHNVDFDEGGARREDVYIEDLLHHTEKGYELLAGCLKPVLEELYAKHSAE